MKTLVEHFEATVSQFPAQVAVTYEDEPIEYGDLQNRIHQMAQELQTAQIGPGNRVLLLVQHPVVFIVLWYALWKRDAIPIPLEAGIPDQELATAVASSQCHFVIAQPEAQLDTRLNRPLEKSALTGDLAVYRLTTGGELCEPGTALFFYTSGTTGLPKCVMFSHSAMVENIIPLARALQLGETDVLLTPLAPVLPACLATAVLPALSVGATLALTKGGLPGKMLRELERTRATVFFAVPYLYELLLGTMQVRQNSDAWSRVRLALTSSASLSGALFDAFYAAVRLPLRSIYCSSEGGACTYNDSETLASIRDSVGKPLAGVELRVVDPEGKTLEPGQEGEIQVRGTHLASGYFQRAELQAAVFADGWVKTGDLGVVDATGYLFLRGRLSATINVSGHLVNPMEVEGVLLQHPMVREALVVRETDPALGEKVVAKVVLAREARPETVNELSAFCVQRLAHYKVPRSFLIVAELEKGRYGKAKRG